MPKYEAEPLFEHIFRCIPFDKTDKPELEAGNRIIMPLSSLHLIQTLHVSFPLFFKIESFTSDEVTHCGVLEFTAEEGFVHLPRWMMRNLSLEEGGDVILHDSPLTEGLYMKLRPHATAFVELPDPKAVLERALRGYACLSRGDTFMVRYDGRDYFLDVLEVGPGGKAVSLIETDCALEFAPPLDYVEPPRREAAARGGGVKREEEKEGVKELRPFAGVARRAAGSGGGSAAVEEVKKDGGKDEGKEEFKAFAGKGRILGGRGLGRVVESGGTSAVARGPVGGAAVAEVKKIEKHDEGKEDFKALAGKGNTMESGGKSAVASGPVGGAAVAEAKKIEKHDGGKEEFKAFSGRGRVLGGPSLDAAVGSGVAPRVPAVVVVEGKKKKRECEKEEAKKKFKAYTTSH